MSVLYDPISPVSLVSVSAVGRLKLAISQGHYFGTLSVPALPSQGLPSSFTSVCEFFLGQDLNCDIVLGMNWIGLCRAAMMDGLVEFHPSSSECYQPLARRFGVFDSLP